MPGIMIVALLYFAVMAWAVYCERKPPEVPPRCEALHRYAPESYATCGVRMIKRGKEWYCPVCKNKEELEP